jgi:putative transposase
MLVQTEGAKNFSVLMKKLNLAYFHWYRKKYGWVGHFWQGRFKSQAVGKDSYFIQCGKYVELNPVRAGFVEDPGEYQYSSYGFYAEGRNNDLISEDMFYSELGKVGEERRRRYRELVVGIEVEGSYKRPVWGVQEQRNNEERKRKYHEKRKLSLS